MRRKMRRKMIEFIKSGSSRCIIQQLYNPLYFLSEVLLGSHVSEPRQSLKNTSPTRSLQFVEYAYLQIFESNCSYVHLLSSSVM
jgi:AAA+ ATPase superfamily predicted ATPase